jgi:hypothetical protein
MSAQFKALTIQNGTSRRILDNSSLEVGLGVNSATGQDLTVHAADFGLGTGTGQQLLITGSAGGTVAGNGGVVDIHGGSSTSGQGGNAWLHGGDSAAGNGGGIAIYGGNGLGGGSAGGDVFVDVGTGAATTGSIYIGSDGAACPVYLGSGASGSIVDVQDFGFNNLTNSLFHVGAAEMLFNSRQNHSIRVASSVAGVGMGLTLTSGDGVGAPGGDINIATGTSDTTTTGGLFIGSRFSAAADTGVVRILSGNGVTGSGQITIAAGTTSGAASIGGSLIMHAGKSNGSGGTGGSVFIEAGGSSTLNQWGKISIGTGYPADSDDWTSVVFIGNGQNLPNQRNTVNIHDGSNTVDALFLVGASAMTFNNQHNHFVNVAGASSGAGKALTVKAGAGATTGNGGSTFIEGGNSAVGAIANAAGSVFINGGAPGGTTSGSGGSVSITAHDALGQGVPGFIELQAGNAIAKQDGGYIGITAGDTASFQQSGGNIDLYAGNCTASTTTSTGLGGTINIVAGGSGASNGGDIAITAGNGIAPFGANGGTVFIDAGNRAGETHVCGDVLVGTSTTTENIVLNSQTQTSLQHSNSDVIHIKTNSPAFDFATYPSLAEIETASILRCVSGGMIDLPAGFGINAGGIGSSVGYTVYANPLPNPGPNGQVTAANLNTLTAGPASDASTLHYHSSAPGALVEYLATTAEVPMVGSPVVGVLGLDGVNTVQLADANGGAARQGCVGLANTTTAATGQPIAISGILPVPYATFDAASSGFLAAGKTVYVSEQGTTLTAGYLTVVAPNTPIAASSVQKVGMIVSINTVTNIANVLLQIGDLTLLIP